MESHELVDTLSSEGILSVCLGFVIAIDDADRPIVRRLKVGPSKSRAGELAWLAVALTRADLEGAVASKDPVLLGISDQIKCPIILGMLRQTAVPSPKSIVIEAENDVTVRSGRSSLQINADGRVRIVGDHLTSRATGVNKIKGAAVQIN